MEAKPIIFIDSDYWIYLFDQTIKEHKYVKEHFNIIYDESYLAINTVVMIEVMHYLVKRLGPAVAKEKWELFTSIDFIIGNLEFDDLDLIFSVFSKYSHTGIGGRDATILGFMEANHISKLCTHDKDFKKIHNIEIIDPIPD